MFYLCLTFCSAQSALSSVAALCSVIQQKQKSCTSPSQLRSRNATQPQSAEAHTFTKFQPMSSAAVLKRRRTAHSYGGIYWLAVSTAASQQEDPGFNTQLSRTFLCDVFMFSLSLRGKPSDLAKLLRMTCFPYLFNVEEFHQEYQSEPN